MKIQVILSLLPILAGLTAAIPAAGPEPAPALSIAAAPVPSDDGADEVPPASDVGESTFDPNNPEWLPTADGLEKRKLPTKLHWESHPNIDFKVGKNINAHVDITMYSDGKVRFYTQMNNQRRWGPYRYAVVCDVRDKKNRSYTLDRKGSVCRKKKSCHIETKDQTATNTKVKTYWQDIANGDRKMHCRAHAEWDFGKVVDWVIDWHKDNKEGVLAVIAIISAVVAVAA